MNCAKWVECLVDVTVDWLQPACLMMRDLAMMQADDPDDEAKLLLLLLLVLITRLNVVRCSNLRPVLCV